MGRANEENVFDWGSSTTFPIAQDCQNVLKSVEVKKSVQLVKWQRIIIFTPTLNL